MVTHPLSKLRGLVSSASAVRHWKMVPLAGPRCGHSVPGWMLSGGAIHGVIFFVAKPLAVISGWQWFGGYVGEFVFVLIFQLVKVKSSKIRGLGGSNWICDAGGEQPGHSLFGGEVTFQPNEVTIIQSIWRWSDRSKTGLQRIYYVRYLHVSWRWGNSIDQNQGIRQNGMQIIICTGNEEQVRLQKIYIFFGGVSMQDARARHVSVKEVATKQSLEIRNESQIRRHMTLTTKRH